MQKFPVRKLRHWHKRPNFIRNFGPYIGVEFIAVESLLAGLLGLVFGEPQIAIDSAISIGITSTILAAVLNSVSDQSKAKSENKTKQQYKQ